MYSVEVTSRGETQFQAKSKDSEFIIDTGGQGMQPLDTLLASLGACIGVYLRYYGAKNSVKLNDFTVKVEADLGKDKPLHFKAITATVQVRNTDLDAKTRDSIVQFIKSCPVHNTLKMNPEIVITIP